MLQITGFMIGMASFLVLCAAIVVVIAVLLIKRYVSKVKQTITEKKYPLQTVKAVISEKTKEQDPPGHFMTFDTEGGDKITVQVSSWEYSMLDIGQEVMFSYRNNIAVDIKPLRDEA